MDIVERKRRAGLITDEKSIRRVVTSDRVEVRSVDGQMQLRGVASSTSVRGGGTLARDNGYDMGWYTERIMAGAFSKTLSEQPDVQLLINHEGLPLARTTNGTLDLREDPDDGLVFDARIDESDPDAQRLAAKISSGLMDQCSFAFRIARKSWDDDAENLDIQEVNLHRGDVSVVNYGANPATSVTLRSLLSRLPHLSTDDITELRSDADLMRVVRELLLPADLEAVVAEELAEPVRMSVDLAMARAMALSLRGKNPRRSA